MCETKDAPVDAVAVAFGVSTVIVVPVLVVVVILVILMSKKTQSVRMAGRVCNWGRVRN